MKIVRSSIVFVLKMFMNDGIFMLLNVKVEVMVHVAFIIYITQITLKFIHNALLVYQRGLCFCDF